MNTLTVVSLLALVTLCLCHREYSADYTSARDSPSSEAFVSRRDSAKIVKRPSRNYHGANIAAVPDPTGIDESLREVCETNIACDELADQVGFREAYRRFYGPV